jgi:hypothetical protein
MEVNIINFITVGAAAGAFIDFYIGKNGQEGVRSWLETWWLRFSYVNLRNFGQQEALYSVSIIDRLFGEKFFSRRRFTSVVLVATFSVIWTIAIPVAQYKIENPLTSFITVGYDILPVSVILFSISISATQIIARYVARNLGKGHARSFMIILLLFVLQYIMLCFWKPCSDVLSMIVFTVLHRSLTVHDLSSPNLLAIFRHVTDINHIYPRFQLDELDTVVHPYMNYALYSGAFQKEFSLGNVYIGASYVQFGSFLGIIANLGRLMLAGVFLVLSIMLPIQPFMLTLWLRTLESDKPVFTLILTGIGGFAQIISWFVGLFTARS